MHKKFLFFIHLLFLLLLSCFLRFLLLFLSLLLFMLFMIRLIFGHKVFKTLTNQLLFLYTTFSTSFLLFFMDIISLLFYIRLFLVLDCIFLGLLLLYGLIFFMQNILLFFRCTIWDILFDRSYKITESTIF